jgi:predicted  nucleic acid-binding Zn-ribbon protein
MSNEPTIPLDRFEQLFALVQKIDKELGEVRTRLESLENTVDKRLKETRPVWEAMEARLEQIEIDLDKVKGMAHDHRAEFRELRRQLKEHLPQLESKAS